MAPPEGKVDAELGFELQPLLENSLSDTDAPDPTERKAGKVTTRFWRRLLLRSVICASLASVALYLILSRPRERHPNGPIVSRITVSHCMSIDGTDASLWL